MAKTKDEQYITRKDIRTELKSFGKDLSEGIVSQIREEFRDQLDSKLTATEKRIMQHTEELLTDQSLELTNAMSEMVVPLQKTDKDHKPRITKFEQHTA